MKKKLLITGGCGAIGSEVINFLKERHPSDEFINIDLLTYAGKTEHIEKPFDNYVFHQGDICDIDFVNSVLEQHKPDYIIHFAAETHVDNSFGNSLKFTMTNVYGTHVLLECVKNYMKNNPFKMFIHFSTDEVYGSVNENETSKTESSFFAPSNPYAATKAGAEMICKSYETSFKVPIVIVRCNNAISKYQNDEKLVPKTINCLLKGEMIPVHGYGTSKRTFIHAYDIATALFLIIEKGAIGKTYNLGTKMEFSVIQVIEMIKKEMAITGHHIKFVEDRLFQDYRYDINSDEIRSLGWKENISFADAIKNVISHKRKIH